MTQPKLPDFSKATVLVVGDVMLDRYWQGSATRISPEAPVPVVRIDNLQERPGGAGNVALNIAALGAHAILLAMTGDDEAADTLATQLQAVGVSTYFSRDPACKTITKLRILSQHQQLLRLDFEENFQHSISEQLFEHAKKNITQVQAIILSDYGKGTLKDSARYIALANAHGIPVFVDPKTDDYQAYQHATVITPNFNEFQMAAGRCENETDILNKGHVLMKKHDLKALLVTRGERGMTLLEGDAAPVHLPAQTHEVYDVTGAGDTVIAVMAASAACGLSLKDSQYLANVAAGISVTKLGAATVSVPELEAAMLQTSVSHAPFGVMTETELLACVRDAKKRGEKIVMTNGCFDLLHPGHITYLREAKALGDRLIVAVNTDESVAVLKGPERPINSLHSRMAVLSGLRDVDWVVPFAEETPARLIAAVLPHVLVKGGDYRVQDIAGGEAVLAQGGRVEILSFVEGYSSTATIHKINKKQNGESS